MSALNDIADEYMTIVKYNDNTISAYLVKGTLKSDNISSENKEIVDVKVGKLVTSIGNYAFENCANLTSFTMPDSVTVINQHAFRYCNSLANLEFSSNISSIGSDSFHGCTSLTSVVLPENLVELGSNVFTTCTGITEVVVPKSIASLGTTPFFGCTSLTSVTFVGKTLAQVQALPLYPWALNATVIKTLNDASQEWTLEQLSVIEDVENSLSNYYTKSETSSAAEISTALALKQDKLSDAQISAIDTPCLPLNLRDNNAISGNYYLDFYC